MTQKEKDRIRARDKARYGVIPEGYNIHHLYYSEEYDPNSFIIITNEEHNAIHGRTTIPSSSGFNKKEYYENYKEENRDAINARQREYNKNHKDSISSNKKRYYEEHKEEIREKQKYYYERRKHRERLIELGVI